MSQGAMAEECRRPAFSGRIAPQHLAAPDPPRSDDSVGVPLTRDAHSWARLRLVADSDRRLGLPAGAAPHALETAPWCALREPERWALQTRSSEHTSG